MKEKRATSQRELQEGYNNDTLPMDQLEAVSNENINQEMQKMQMKLRLQQMQKESEIEKQREAFKMNILSSELAKQLLKYKA
jgi:uncharacterized protein with gpF-like domain